MRNGGPEQRRRRVLRAGLFQVLWALLLVYLILLGLSLLFGRQVGYDMSFAVCGWLAALVTAAFLAVYLLDRGSACLVGRFRRAGENGKEAPQKGTPK